MIGVTREDAIDYLLSVGGDEVVQLAVERCVFSYKCLLTYILFGVPPSIRVEQITDPETNLGIPRTFAISGSLD